MIALENTVRLFSERRVFLRATHIFSVYASGYEGGKCRRKNKTKKCQSSKVLKALHWCLRLLFLAEAQSSQRHVEMTEEAVYRAIRICMCMSMFKQLLTKFILPNESPHQHGE